MIYSSGKSENHIHIPIWFNRKLSTRTKNNLIFTFNSSTRNIPALKTSTNMIPDLIRTDFCFLIPLCITCNSVYSIKIYCTNILIWQKWSRIRLIRLIIFWQNNQRRIYRKSRRINYFPLYNPVTNGFSGIF
ncbi:hypothetical protein D3C84_672790 [compost metagenome]